MTHEKLVEHGENLKGFIAQVEKLDTNSMEIAISEGEWSPASVLHHVADTQLHFAIRYFNALTIEKPALIRFDEDIYPELLNYKERSWETSLTLIKSLGSMIQIVLSPISNEQWERGSIHPELGDITISALIGKASNHLVAHTAQLTVAS